MKKNAFLTMGLVLLNFALWGLVNNMSDNLVPAFQSTSPPTGVLYERMRAPTVSTVQLDAPALSAIRPAKTGDAATAQTNAMQIPMQDRILFRLPIPCPSVLPLMPAVRA